MRALTGLRTALGTLTVLPVGAFEPDPRASVPWFPWIGGLFGLLALGIASFAQPWVQGGLGALFVGAGIVGAWAMLSGLLHWDGLADTADGLLGGDTPEEKLRIMRDSHAGAFGAFAVAFVLVAQVVCAAVVFAGREWTVLALAPMAGRLAATFMACVFRPARAEGLGASANARPFALVWGALPLVAVAVFQVVLHTAGPLDRAALHLFALVLTLGGAWALVRPLKGYTGDTLGASVLLVETAVLALGAVRAIVMSAAL